MAEAKVIITESGEKFAALPLEEFRAVQRALERIMDELELLRAEQAAAKMDAGEEPAIPAEVVGRVIADGVHPLKAIREWRGLNQAELAGRAGTSKSYLSQIETGYRQPGRKLLIRLARILEVPVDVLMEPPAGEDAAE